MSAPVTNPDPRQGSRPAAVSASPPARRTPTYDRGQPLQDEFDAAVERLRSDAWLNPRTKRRELRADLVLEGGGVKGIGLAGAICVLAEAGYHFPRTAGTSAGAIAAVLTAAVQKSGKDMSVLRDYLASIDYRRFTHTSPLRHACERVAGRFAEVCELAFRSGLYSGDYLTTWLAPLLAECGVRTWADLALTEEDDPDASLPPDQRYRAVVHVSDLTLGTLARLPGDYENYYGLKAGEQDVITAVRASMSIPFFFVPVQVPTRPARLQLPDGLVIPWPGGTVTWVDGGMLMNFPITAFDRTDGQHSRWPTIGVKLSAEPTRGPVARPVGNTVDEGYHCLTTVLGEWDRYHVDQTAADRIIFVPNLGITATQFDLSEKQQAALFRSGAQAATKFLIERARSSHPPTEANGKQGR